MCRAFHCPWNNHLNYWTISYLYVPNWVCILSYFLQGWRVAYFFSISENWLPCYKIQQPDLSRVCYNFTNAIPIVRQVHQVKQMTKSFEHGFVINNPLLTLLLCIWSFHLWCFEKLQECYQVMTIDSVIR